MAGQQPFLSDVQAIRARARLHLENGAVTENYGADKETVIRLLNEALATEIVCTLRYKRHYFMAQGPASAAIAAEFLEHANEEQAHADRIAERIVQLGGQPDFSPEGLATRSHAEYVEGNTLGDMILEDLVAERVAIESYREMVQYLGATIRQRADSSRASSLPRKSTPKIWSASSPKSAAGRNRRR